MIDEHRETFDENNIRDFVDLYLAKEKNDTQKQITGFDYMHIEWHLMTNTRTSLMLVWHLHDFWPRICRGKSCHFWDTNWEATALFTTSSCIVHEEFKTSTRMLGNQCPHWHELARRVHPWFAHSLRIVYVLPALARRVCAIRTVSYRLGHAI